MTAETPTNHLIWNLAIGDRTPNANHDDNPSTAIVDRMNRIVTAGIPKDKQHYEMACNSLHKTSFSSLLESSEP